MSHARTRVLTCGYGGVIGLFAGLIGVGGAELRMPVLVTVLGLTAARAVPVNLCISLATLIIAFATRRAAVSGDLNLLGVEVAAIAVGSVLASSVGAKHLHRIPDGLHTRLIAGLLFLVAALMVIGLAVQPVSMARFANQSVRVPAGFFAGAMIGTISGLFGMAGGQITIPTLVFLFGADIKTAGTASLLINLPTVAAACARAWHVGRFRDNQDVSGVALPMGAGSVVGAMVGGVLSRITPGFGLRVVFAVVLVWSGCKMIGRARSRGSN